MSNLLSRLVRTARTRWRTMLLLTGGLLTLAGITLPSGPVFLAGTLLLLFALLTETEAPDCRTAAQLTPWHWSG